MTTRPKKKMCWNCEGNVNLTDEMCPYCGVAVSQISLDSKEDNQSLQTSSSYRLAKPSSNYNIPSSPYGIKETGVPKEAQNEPEEQPPVDLSEPENQSKTIVVTMALMMAGGVFFLFGWVLLLFAQNGYLTLRWNESLWYIYILLALPMLYFGYRNLQYLKEE